VGSDELTSATRGGLARLIAGREVAAREVVEPHLRRIGDVNGAINAVVQVDGARALIRADQADAALARGERWGAPHGVPFTVKDNIAGAGIPMAIGVRERVGTVAATDATAVARLKAAGGILLGKTNCPPWGGGIETDNDLYGRTSNPYDLARTPGGSSGGEAAIIAAQGSPCGLGTDSGASVRLPAHFCGLASIKPSAGRVPLTGVLDDEGQPARSAIRGRRSARSRAPSATSRCCCGSSPDRTGTMPASPPSRWATPATSRSAACASRCRRTTASSPPHPRPSRRSRRQRKRLPRPAPRSRRRTTPTAGTS
jgi:Asp-tRNA(Asn)/Glu-tRNA(Gln) amidotransferase A subunit family amidase